MQIGSLGWRVESGMDRKGPGKIEHTDIVPTALHKDLTSGSFGVFTIGTENQLLKLIQAMTLSAFGRHFENELCHHLSQIFK